MRTTMLIVEFLVGGILISLALIFSIESLFPGEVDMISRFAGDTLSTGELLLLSTVFVAVAYTVGIFSEVFARGTFEWMLRRVVRKRVRAYLKSLKDLKEYDANLTEDPILKKLEHDYSKRSKKTHIYLPIGLMRFYVLMKNPELYEDISSQLHRYRLLRMLFLAVVLFIVGIAVQMIYESSPFLSCALMFLIVIAVLDVAVIYDRFNRYCRAIERSYTVLMLDNYQKKGEHSRKDGNPV